MGAGGEDVQLSPAARDLFPYSVECKSMKAIAVYNWYAQCQSNAPARAEPLLVIKQNQSRPLAVIDLDHFMAVLTERDELQNSCNHLLDALTFTGKTMEKELPAAYAAGVAAGKRGGTQ